MLTMLHAYALEGGTGVQCSCKSWLHEDCVSCKSWLHEDCVIAIDTGQPKICPEFFTVRLKNLIINSVGLISTQQDQLHTISSTLT